MTFAWPDLLWLLVVPVAWCAWDLLLARRRAVTAVHPKISLAEAGSRQVSLAPPRTRATRVRPWFYAGLALAIAALARPQWGRVEEPVFDQAREILIAIDLSRSMLTPDVRPSRLDRAKLLTQSLLERLAGERVGLVVFSGTAFLQSPLSADYEILREFLPSLDPSFLPEGGTNYRALIDTSLSAFGGTTAADRFLIILSDGEATEDNWRDRVNELKSKGVRVIALGVGTAAGALVPDGQGGLVKDERGAVVLSKLESATLRELADQTSGVYQDASSWIDLAGLINATVEAGRRGKFTEKNAVRLVERFQWPLGLALWCLIVSAYFELPVRPRSRELKLAGPGGVADTHAPREPAATGVAIVALLLALAAAPGVLAATAASAPKPPPPSPPLLSRIVGRLSTAEERSARDWSEMSQETVTWGARLQTAGQPVPEGPVRDALSAVDLGERMDRSVTDWPKLRAQLEDLLKKPEEQKQQQQQQQKQQNQNQQDQPKQEQQQQSDQQQQKPPQSNESPSQNNSGQSKPQEQPEQQKKENQSAFGDMKERGQPPPAPETQKVGGTPDRNTAKTADPAMAMPLQKLDQLRNQDSPAELFKLMQADKEEAPRRTKKDW